jgi:hypothetical protein|tara:strand:+ start:429 stop:1109 length:681 start_codon:yes stop_codon:yes gene_type:complete
MALNWTTTNRASEQGVKMLVYGKSGMGKTKLCATAPTPLILSAEAGLLSLRAYDIPVLEINTTGDLTEAYNWIRDSAEAKQFQTICLDSISEIAEVVLAHAKKQVKDPRQAYGELIEKMGATIRLFRDLKGFNVYMSAKEAYEKDESGVMSYMPSMPGSKLGAGLPYYFDEVFHLSVGKTPEGVEYRYLRTQPDFNTIAKDRSGALDLIEAADLNNVITKICQQTN